MEKIKLGGYKIGLFSKKKATKSAKGKNSIVDEFAADEIKEKENFAEKFKNEMVTLGKNSSRISSAINDVNNSLLSLSNATLTQAEKSSISDSVKEIDDCIANLTSASSEKDNVLSIMYKVTTISQEHSALSEEITANMDLQNRSLEELDSNVSTINYEYVKYEESQTRN
ncbi:MULTISPECIES: hypothetical protein [unclassified Clostridium]|uniref:hypothetical protein n=1 Tax=unclassified Clostridium TaxID=2614128 RepID=UPI002A8207EE|nr:hypothetical protein [Clostridium sp.]MDY4252108.1 hypothetical protein [Clostridium sp.]